MNKRKLISVFILSILLTACGATPYGDSPSVYSNSDPNTSAEIARQTKQAAAEQENLFQAQAASTSQAYTAAAYAPIAAITQAAAELEIQNLYAQATSTAAVQTQIAGVTATAQSWTPTPNATSTVVAAQAIAIQTQITNQSKRQNITNNFWAVILPIFLLSVLLVVAFVGISWSRDHRVKVHPSNVPGDKPMLENTVTGEIVDMDANPNYAHKDTSLVEQMFEQWLQKKYGFVPKLPMVTDERQDRTKERDQFIDLKSRVTTLPKALTDSQGMRFLSEPTEPLSAGLDTFPLPAWNKLVEYPFKAGGEFPFGAFAQELARIDVNKYPHLGLVGPTGSGKSRMFLRPFIASALASGNRVIVLGDMVDFIVFKVHPNATLVPVYQITKPDDAAQYVNALKVINGEMEHRFQLLAERGLSTWEHFGGENTLIVLDELGPNLDILDDTNPQAARALRGFLSILISKGRKAGFNFVFASTRAVGLKKQLSQVSTIAFRLKDTDEERYTFGQSGFGAERIPEHYFLSKIGSDVRMTGSFNPSDQELGEFLMRHTTKALDKPTWIEGVFKPVEDVKQVTAKSDAGSLPVMNVVADDKSRDEEIWKRYCDKQSLARIQREVFGDQTTGGANFNKIKAVLAKYGDYGATTTTGENSPFSGDFGAVAV